MAWTVLTFPFGSVLTSAKMTQLYDNFTAFANKDSGAPVLKNDYIVNAMIATNAVNADSIIADSVGTSEIQTNSVKQGEIHFIAGASFAGNLNAATEVDIALSVTALFPMIHTTSAQIQLSGHSVDGVSGTAPRFRLRNYDGSNSYDYDVDHYYTST